MKKYFLYICIIMSINIAGMSQNTLPIRKAAVAGKFYSNDSAELLKYFEKEFNQITILPTDNKTRALIVPHAGYFYSGRTAAYGYSTVREKNKYKNVFIIGNSHIAAFDGATVFHGSAFETPLGNVEINSEITGALQQNNIFKFPQQYQASDHILEVQIPFLQYVLDPDFKIVPITIGTKSKYALNKITELLKPYFTEENLFVISTDLSHYTTYSDAIKADNAIVQSILSGDVNQFEKAVEQNESAGIKNYVTAICGYSAVYVLMKLTGESNDFVFEKQKYSNSGDVSNETDRVVGYVSISVRERDKKEIVEEEETLSFSDDEKKIIFDIVRGSIEAKFGGKKYSLPDNLPEMLNEKCGVFVTLKLDDRLRGCIGTFRQDKPLAENLNEMAISAAFGDPRFMPLTENEYKIVEIEVSVLTPMQKISDEKKIVLGKHGIYIKRGNMSGTFLPQVATETGWTLDEFLGHCSRDKVGIGWDGWKKEGAELYIYESIILNE